ncbi:hypothetical protein OG21DRAFT_1464357 [Imleria badia]|nr:hypothetical protein OG21DRAFT_1464357 [Imleria badia]
MVTKLLLLIVGVIVQRYGSTPPNVRPPTEQLREQHGVECAVPWITTLARIQLWPWALFEGWVLLVLSGYCPPALARPLLDVLPTSFTSDPTPAFVAGTLLAVSAGLLRAHCFHALGPHFTFELSIRPAQALVTHGVYGVVRHPSYTAALGLAAGWMLCVLDRRGAVVSVCTGVLVRAFNFGGDGWGDWHCDAVVTGVWVTGVGLLCVLMSRRMDREDAMLEENFGEAWRAWAKRVPYRLIPGVY